MRKTWWILTIFAVIVGIVFVNIKEKYSQPVASGSAGVLLFVFLWFILFVLPRLRE
jgi:hypothetical protein